MVKKIVLISILLLVVISCAGQVQQASVNLNDYIAGLDPNVQDIPLTNMPGHELPECPLECVCPNWFGLSESHCVPAKKSDISKVVKLKIPEIPMLMWHKFTDDLLDKATKNNRLVMLFYVREDDYEGNLILENLDYDKCFVEEVWKHYYLTRTSDLDLYYHALNDHNSGKLGWPKGDYVMSPAVAVFYKGRVLPITFESKKWFSSGELPYYPTEPSHLCVVAKALYGAMCQLPLP